MPLSLNRIGAIVLRQLYLLRASPVRVLPLFAWAAIDIVLWGFITLYLDTIVTSSLSLVSTLLGAVLLWSFFGRVMHGVTTAFLEDVWSRNFLNLFASPLTIAEYISGLVITSILTSLIGLVVMLVLAALAFGLSFAVYGIMLLPFLLLLFLFGIALGVFASAVVLRFGPASEWFVWPMPALLSPFVGVFYPLDTLPAWMQGVAYALPPSYVFEGMRQIVLTGAFSAQALLWSGSLVLVYIVLACWCFVRVHRYAVNSGLIARYSAESLS